MSGKILIAEDDAILREFISAGLRQNRYAPAAASSVFSFIEIAQSESFDLWIIDRRLPDGDGLVALKELRAKRVNTPALILTALGRVDQRVEGFSAGADDYLTKPFSIEELIARVRAVLRRPPVLTPIVVQAGPLKLQVEEGRVFWEQQEIYLTAREWRLLRMITARPNVVFSRPHIMEEVGMSEETAYVAVDHLVSRLRTKLRPSSADRLINTVRGIGFKWLE